MKICISGATGFVGAHLVRFFSNKGYDVLAIGRQKKPPEALLKFASWKQIDLTQKIPPIHCDICIHAAALASDQGTLNKFVSTNVRGTQNLFQAIHAALFINISSGSVYSVQKKQEKIKEIDAFISPQLSNYGRSKLLAEQFLEKQKGLTSSIITLRPRAIYGVQDRVLLPKILSLVKKNRLLLLGDAKVDVSMTHISNLIIAIERCIEYRPEGYTVFNVADEQIYVLREVLTQLIFGAYKRTFSIVELPISILKPTVKILEQCRLSPQLSSQALNYMTTSIVLETSKIKSDLGYQTTTDFYKQLPHLIQWIQSVGFRKIIKEPVTLPWQNY